MRAKDQDVQVAKVRTREEITRDIIEAQPGSVFGLVRYDGPARVRHGEGFAHFSLRDEVYEAVIDIIDDDDQQRRATGRVMELLRELARSGGNR